MSRNFDAIIIGSGQASPAFASRFSAAGMRVAIIERHKFGGTCVNPGCIPTKTLVASAYAAHIARRGADYGFVIDGNVRVDMKRVKARKDGVAGGWERGGGEGVWGAYKRSEDSGEGRIGASPNGCREYGIIPSGRGFITTGRRGHCP